ncbi:galactose-1-phosphate uridylyltransferase [Peptoanaerobacter stomatis]
MSEIRLDFVTKRAVIFTNIRENKPTDLWDKNIMNVFEKFDDIEYSQNCPFCVGNEHMTPENQYDSEENWKVKIIPNMYPIIQTEMEIKSINKFCYVSTGIHDVIVETPKHNETYFTMDLNQFNIIYEKIHKRYKELINNDDISYVSLFKNYKMLGGASLQHSHSQILSLDAIPIKLNYEINSSYEYYKDKHSCPYCDMLNFEMKAEKRIIYENEYFIALEPYASAYKYETWILPKNHISSFENEDKISYLSEILYKVFNLLYNTIGNFPFNMYLNSLLKNKTECKDSYHYSFRIIPKIAGSAGFEMSSGIRVNSVYPEDAAYNILKKNNLINI